MVAIYARQSIDKKDSISIETQVEFAKREVFDEECKVYQDSGYSGKNTKRPAFTQMMRDIKSGHIDKVIVYRLDRISRSLVDFADFIDILETSTVAFVSATEKFDTSAPMGRAMLYIIIVFAQLERETIAERVRDSYYARVKKGAWGGGPPAFGFDLVRSTVDGKKATIYQANEDIVAVQRIFELYSIPYASLASVQKSLTKDGYVSSKGTVYNSSRLSIILKNPAYVKADHTIYNFYQQRGAIMANDPEEFDGIHGCILAGKRNANDRKYKDVSNHVLAISHHEGIVESSTFLLCQQKLASNQQIKNTFQGKYSWLTGLIKCGDCGYALTARTTTYHSEAIVKFNCSGRYVYHCCENKQAYPVREVEAEVEELLVDRVQDFRLSKAKKEDVNAKHVQEKISNLDAKIENLIASLETANAITAEYVNQRVEALHNEKPLLLEQYTKSLSTANTKEVAPFSIGDWRAMSLEEKREIARSMIGRVVINQDGINVELL